MSLGTIAHLQHYFSRTGLLDGKGGQLAKEESKMDIPDGRSGSPSDIPTLSQLRLLKRSSSPGFEVNYSSDAAYNDESSLISSPDQSFAEGSSEPDALGLPPTFSTYKQKPTYVPPPPNLNVLRRELREALEDARKLLADLQSDEEERNAEAKSAESSPGKQSSFQSPQSWHELQGLQVLDLVTLAIRAAKNFYTSHEQPKRLYDIKSERKIRSELFTVLETLKKAASRQFVGGIRKSERQVISVWMNNIEELVSQDESIEKQEHERRQRWVWLDGEWKGKERQREWLFIKSFESDPDSIPEWTEPGDDGSPSPFLDTFRNGIRLVHLHNELVRSSRRHFEEIKVFHTDTGKPYRCAENLRYWTKAAELRWDAFLKVDVPGIVHGSNSEAWKSFDGAILAWCQAVREELTREWLEHQEAMKVDRPIVRMDRSASIAAVPWAEA